MSVVVPSYISRYARPTRITVMYEIARVMTERRAVPTDGYMSPLTWATLASDYGQRSSALDDRTATIFILGVRVGVSAAVPDGELVLALPDGEHVTVTHFTQLGP